MKMDNNQILMFDYFILISSIELYEKYIIYWSGIYICDEQIYYLK